MGWLGDALKGVAGIATKFIPGPVDDIIVDAASRALGGSGQVSNRSQTNILTKMSGRQGQPPYGGSPALTPVGMQSRPQLPPLNLPGLPPQGAGFDTPAGRVSYFEPQGGGGTQVARRAGAQLPMVGAIATEPEMEQITRRDCGPGRVLAMDGLCYPKKMLPKTFRMHPPAPKPVVSAADRKAIQRAERTKKKLVNLTKQAGAHASLTKPRRK